jgi:two-component system, OmpR family, sensor histidine kinase KdpD
LNLFSALRLPRRLHYVVSIATVLLVSLLCFAAQDIIGYRIVALILLMTVSVLAMVFAVLPVLIAAALSALIWNFFFIPPVFTFHIDNTEDLLMFLLYFFIALVNAVLTFKIRQAEQKARDKEEKEKSIKLYNTLLNSLSHELRTPIATILGSVDALQDGGAKLSASNQSELLHSISDAGIRLNRQVENILNMSRLESGMLQPKQDWCDVNELVNGVIQKIPEGNSHIIRFTADESLPLFKMDSGFFEQILQNLLHNAVQYTPDHTIVEVRVYHDQENCVLHVSDNGGGFPDKEIPLVFDKFYRVPHTKSGGSGLGLSIVKGFTEAQNGTVQLENNQRGGATFTVTIPAETSYLTNLTNE